jgi:biopolymer transport protein ExbB/TolQ
MRHLLRLQRSSLIYCALALAAILGWSSFAYSTWSARQLSRQVSILTTERDEAIADRNAVRAEHEQLQRSARELRQVEAKLNMGNAELDRTVRAWAAAEQKLAILNKRVEEAKEGVSQTGSIRLTAPPKRPAR